MYQSTSLSNRGYSISKEEVGTKELDTIKAELTVSPFVLPEFNAVKQPPFRLYMESESRIYLPKYYGLKKFGVPATNKLTKKVAPISLQFTGILRPEQLEPVDKMLDACRNPAVAGGILNLFCGAGKTTMSLYVMCELGLKTLIVVHKDFLLTQWKERIEQFVPGARIGMIKAKIVDVQEKDIVLASLQSLSMKTYDDNVFDGFGTVIIDEVHHTSAEVFSQALKKINALYSIGLSATVKRKDGLSKVFMWFLGDIIYKSEKRKDNVRVIVKDYYDPAPIYSREHFTFGDKLNIAKMINNVCNFFSRTEFMTKVLMDVLKKEPERKVLVLSDRRSHLDLLKQYYDRIGLSCGLYYGGLKASVLAESESKQVILATFAIASEGYDQKGLDTLVLASPKTDIVQSVGRILRDKEHERKHVPVVIDIVDKFSIFERQGQKRVKYYKSCGYVVDYEPIHDNTPVSLKQGKCYL